MDITGFPLKETIGATDATYLRRWTDTQLRMPSVAGTGALGEIKSVGNGESLI
jgi:hypothetical protein